MTASRARLQRGPRIIRFGAFSNASKYFCEWISPFTELYSEIALRGDAAAARTVEVIMRKRINLLSSIAVAAVFLIASPAGAQYDGHYIWNTTYYSDSSHQNAVGFLMWVECRDDQASYRLVGQQTAYQEIDGPVGECGDELHPNS
jgi:hypothetical protein